MSSNYPPNQPPPGGNPPQGGQGQPPSYGQSGGYPPPGGSYQYPGQPGYQQAGYQQGGVPPRKNRTWFWILGGCATLIVVCIVGFFAVSYFVYNKAKKAAKDAGIDTELMQKNPTLAAAKAAVALDPDVELVSSDDDKGTLTIRDKKTGETITVNAQDVNKGKVTFQKDGKEIGSINVKSDKDSASFEVKSDQGSFKMGTNISDKLPNWLPAYPGTSIQWTTSVNSADSSHSGSFNFNTTDSADSVVNFYSDALKRAGLNVTTSTTSAQGGTGTYVAGGEQSSKRSCFVTISTNPKGPGLLVGVIFGNKE